MENSTLPIRKSPRAAWLGYNDGNYFVTVCTKDKAHYFGEVVDDTMCFTPIGTFLDNELRSNAFHHPDVLVRCFVVMPNHFHAIVKVTSEALPCNADAPRRVPTREERLSVRVGTNCQCANAVFSSFIGQLKSAVIRFARREALDFAWLPRYHDHLIRGPHDGNRIAEYIEHNVMNWATDCFRL